MMTWIVSSSVLILTVLLIRRLTLGKISMRLRYALWGIVLLRLLIPFSFGSTPVSVMNTAQQVPVIQEAQALQGIHHIQHQPSGNVEGFTQGDTHSDAPAVIASHKTEEEFTRMTAMLNTRDVLLIVWKAGTALMLAVFLLTNLHFRHTLKKNRRRLDMPEVLLPVYVTDSVETPCLFGFLHPAVYVTPEVQNDPKALHYALEHELTHFYHGDFVWTILRCACLSIHWFNPLVWIAVHLSRQDAELACDEGTIRRIGEDRRMDYGNTLIDLTCARRKPTDLLYASTTMTGSMKSIRQRVTYIAKRPKTLGVAVLSVILLISVAVGCTFTGADSPKPEKQTGEAVPLTAEELDFFNEDFFSSDRILPQFLSSMYETPEEIDLFELFYNGPAEPSVLSDAELQELEPHFDGLFPNTDCDRLPVKELDTILNRYLGMPLNKTLRLGMEKFIYLDSTDAYYHFHGDTNARGPFTFTQGVRQGDQVTLFYRDLPMQSGFKALTLREVGDSWQFLSNIYAPVPTRPAEQVKEEPFLTVDLADMTEIHPQVVQTEPFIRQEWAQLVTSFRYERNGSQPDMDILAGVWPDGCIYACLNTGDETYHRFAKLCEAENRENFVNNPEWITLRGFTDLLGRYDGFTLTADGYERTYCFDENDQLCLLLDDTDMDRQFTSGKTTWAFDAYKPQIVAQMEKKLVQVDLDELLRQELPEMTDLSFLRQTETGVGQYHYYDTGKEYLPGCQLRISVDGTSLHIFRGDGVTYTDKAADHIQVPDAVMTAARETAQADYDWACTLGLGPLDDWRIRDILLEDRREVNSVPIEVYRVCTQYHTPKPEEIVLAGGSAITEDNWLNLDSGYQTDWLPLVCFSVEDGQYTRLDEIPNGNETVFNALEKLNSGALSQKDADHQREIIYQNLQALDWGTYGGKSDEVKADLLNWLKNSRPQNKEQLAGLLFGSFRSNVDGWMAENYSSALAQVFLDDPLTFMRVLAREELFSSEEQWHVISSVVYGGSATRQDFQQLYDAVVRQKDVATVDLPTRHIWESTMSELDDARRQFS